MYAKPDAQMRADQDPWFYDGSKLALRGPERDFTRPFVAVLGGSETFGKHVALPYPALLERRIGMPVANLGVMHAGVSLFSKERWLLDIASQAELTVIQVMGAQNMSNRLYCVHPRRNDRFLASSSALRVIYPDVDLAEVNFTGHLLSTLEAEQNGRFHLVIEELRWAWVQRMQRVVKCIRSDVVLLWLSERAPDAAGEDADRADPMFVTQAMLDELSPLIAGITQVVVKRPGSVPPDVPFACSEAEAHLHEAAADALARNLGPRLASKGKGPDRPAGAPENSREDPDQSFSISSGTAVNRSATRP